MKRQGSTAGTGWCPPVSRRKRNEQNQFQTTTCYYCCQLSLGHRFYRDRVHDAFHVPSSLYHVQTRHRCGAFACGMLHCQRRPSHPKARRASRVYRGSRRHVAVFYHRKPRDRIDVCFFFFADHGDSSHFRDDWRPTGFREQNHSAKGCLYSGFDSGRLSAGLW